MMSALQNSMRTVFAHRRILNSFWPRLVTKTSCCSEAKMAGEGTVKVEQLEGVTLIGINRPEKRNCVNTPTAEALLKAFQEFDADESSKVAVLYGVGGNFCAGYDLKEVAEDVPVSLGSYGRGPMGPSRFETRKPVIAAVEGFAVAGGLELALWCDLRIVEETAVMGVYCRRFGVPLIDGGTVRLPAIVGVGRALDLILTGRAIKAKEALEWGIANRLVACGTAIGQAVKMAQELLKFPQECMLADRASVYNAVFNAKSLQEALQFEHENGCPVIFKVSGEKSCRNSSMIIERAIEKGGGGGWGRHEAVPGRAAPDT
ncbi:probable enoyl-CoA hydratase [Portunus trituberculatus]|uniref:probable enoyl-CoA hydratase n=1 Tax=Portunus trituberculatus TaxID=210409 RepID=UPI001E1CEFCB|nr:probable enoyl-CoA hydratase [Portunus trituberculatus]